ncbi:MAG: twin-arginine translocation signal domain-containing protein, partial [Candidatus Hodarchaeota archaeon]
MLWKKGPQRVLTIWDEIAVKLRVSRRDFLKKIGIGGGVLLASPYMREWHPQVAEAVSFAESSKIVVAKNGTPEQNMEKILEMLGGISNLFGIEDVVVIKPNAQWWNQGCPNLAALKKLVELVLERPGGFHGEVIVAENCHRGSSPQEHPESAWGHDFDRNSDITGVKNLVELCSLLKTTYGNQFTTYHWIDVDGGGKRGYGPGDGDGYVYCDGTGGVPLIKYDNGATGGDYRETIMTYPIFTSDRGTVVDLKNGIWEGGTYTGQPLKFINVAALNNHGDYTGITSAIKNYLGVSDLSGGADPYNGGRLIGNYYNFHSFPFNTWAAGPVPGMLGGEVGTYLTTIRKAFLNITTAEWIGLTSRT